MSRETIPALTPPPNTVEVRVRDVDRDRSSFLAYATFDNLQEVYDALGREGIVAADGSSRSLVSAAFVVGLETIPTCFEIRVQEAAPAPFEPTRTSVDLTDLPHADIAALGRHVHAVASTRDRALRDLAALSPLDVDLDALVAVAKAHIPGDLLRALAEIAEGDGDLPHLVSADEAEALNRVRAATLPDRDAYLTVLAQAATIAQLGGIATSKLEVLLRFAAIGWVAPGVRDRLEREGLSLSTTLPGGSDPSAPEPGSTNIAPSATREDR